MVYRLIRFLGRLGDHLFVEGQPYGLNRGISRATFAKVLGGAVVTMALPATPLHASGCSGCDEDGGCGECDPDEEHECFTAPPWVISGGGEHCWCTMGGGGETWTRVCDCVCDETKCTCSKTGSSTNVCQQT